MIEDGAVVCAGEDHTRLGPSAVDRLQRLSGNASVSALLNAQRTTLGDTETGQPNPTAANARVAFSSVHAPSQHSETTLAATQRQTATSQSSATLSYEARTASAYNSYEQLHASVDQAIATATKTLNTASIGFNTSKIRYDAAYSQVAATLKDAGKTLEAQEELRSAVMFGLSVALGLGIGALFNSLRLADDVLEAVVSEIAEVGVGKTIGGGGTDPFKDLAEQSTSSESKSLEDQKALLANSLTALDMVPLLVRLHGLAVKASELKGAAGTGVGLRAGQQKNLFALETALPQVRAKTTAAISALADGTFALKMKGIAAQYRTINQWEQDIWLEWIANIPTDRIHELLDLDPIESRLKSTGVISVGKSRGILPVNFEISTTPADTSEAYQQAIEYRYDKVGPLLRGMKLEIVGVPERRWVVDGIGQGDPYQLTLPGGLARPKGENWTFPCLFDGPLWIESSASGAGKEWDPEPKVDFSDPESVADWNQRHALALARMPVVGHKLHVSRYDPSTHLLHGVGPAK